MKEVSKEYSFKPLTRRQILAQLLAYTEFQVYSILTCKPMSRIPDLFCRKIQVNYDMNKLTAACIIAKIICLAFLLLSDMKCVIWTRCKYQHQCITRNWPAFHLLEMIIDWTPREVTWLLCETLVHRPHLSFLTTTVKTSFPNNKPHHLHGCTCQFNSLSQPPNDNHQHSEER